MGFGTNPIAQSKGYPERSRRDPYFQRRYRCHGGKRIFSWGIAHEFTKNSGSVAPTFGKLGQRWGSYLSVVPTIRKSKVGQPATLSKAVPRVPIPERPTVEERRFSARLVDSEGQCARGPASGCWVGNHDLSGAGRCDGTRWHVNREFGRAHIIRI